MSKHVTFVPEYGKCIVTFTLNNPIEFFVFIFHDVGIWFSYMIVDK